MSSLPFEVYVRHRGYRLPFPLHRWHLPEEREENHVSENFKPSEFDPVSLIFYRSDPKGLLTLSIDGTPFQIKLEEGENYRELAAWTPPKDEDSDAGEGLWGRSGIYRIRASHGSDAWVTTIEVQPHYLSFEQLGRMCADIERISTWVAYDILPYAPVIGSRLPRLTRDESAEEDPAVLFALLKETVPEALRTLRFLSSSPHLALKPTYVATRAGVSARQDRRSMRMEERLNEREEGWTVQRVGDLTYDIYENRFVKRLLTDLHRRLSQLQSMFMDSLDELERQEDEVRRRLRRQFGDQEERIRKEEPLWTRPIRNRRSGLRSQIVACGRMKDALAAVMRTDVLREVKPLRGIVRPTNILQHDPQYSRLWSIYRLLRLSDRGDSSMAHRFHRHSRPSWELYEMWTAVQVMEACMRDLRFTRVISQSMAEGDDHGVTFMYDTPRPATLRLAHETEPLQVEVIYGGFIPMSEAALTKYRFSRPEALGKQGVAGGEEQGTDLGDPPISPTNGEPDSTGEEPDAAMSVENGRDPVADGETGPDGEAGEASPNDTPPRESSDTDLPTLLLEDSPLLTRGVQTAPDVQMRFTDSESGELLGVLILDAKYKAGRRIWGREGGRPTNDRLALESYKLDIHRRDRQEAAMALFSEPADDIVLGAYALYPGERFGRDLDLEERRSADGEMGAVKVSPDGSSEELTRLLMETLARVQVRRTYLHSGYGDSPPSSGGVAGNEEE